MTWQSLARCALTILAVVWLPMAVRAQRDLTNIPDPDPEQERRSFQVADGFEVNLFAADLLLAKPIQINFDPAGRLWVASSDLYPQIKPGQKPTDRILILEDRDGDGRADRMTVFADGLLIPTGVAPGDGGAYVADSTELVHFTERDGKAAGKRIVLSGFGTEDTHHILHTLRWGPDGMLYFNQSIYIHSHIETPYGVRRLNGGGIWQFRPETMQLEVLAHGFCNPWAHLFDRWGQSFATDGAYGEGINYVLPGASYVFTPGATRIVAGLNPGSPKHCGAEVLSGRHLPEEWRGNILTNDFRGHRVCRFVISEDGAAYASQERAELIKTNHAAFRPVDVKMGPDGAIYIADWYNPIIQHGEVDFRDPRRDHTHGRIWRVTARGRPLVPRPRLVGAPTEALLEALKAPEDWTRQQAKRVLKERGPGVLPALAKWVGHLEAGDPAHEHHLLEALWTYQSLNTVEPRLLERLLNAQDHHAQAAATRVIAYWHDRLTDPMGLLAARVQDEHPQVRLEAVRALAHLRDPRAVEVALQALHRPVDRYLDYALWLTAQELGPIWLPALDRGQVDFGGDSRLLVFALKAVGTPAVVRPLLARFRAGRIAAENQAEALSLIASLGDPRDLTIVLDAVTARGPTRPGQQVMLLQALEQAARQRKVFPDGDRDRIGSLLASGDGVVQASAARLVGLWHVESQGAALCRLAGARQRDATVAEAAIEGLASLGGAASARELAKLADPPRPLPLRKQAAKSLLSLDLEAGARKIVSLLTSDSAGNDPVDLFSALLERKNGAETLGRMIAGQRLSAEVARAGLRAVRSTGQAAPALTQALAKAGNLAGGWQRLSPEELRQLVREVVERGRADRGETLFRRKDLACLKCHAIAGSGGLVGPDLASIGASAPIDYLIESILLPSKAIKENYHALLVATRDGRLISGIKVRETSTDLVLRDAEDREVTIARDTIEERKLGGSLMPEGLADALTRSELVDLVRFLSELGKVGPYAVSKAAVARTWQALEPTEAAFEILSSTSFASAARADAALTWTPAYSKVSGVLPLDALPPLRFGKPQEGEFDLFGFARCQIEVAMGGKTLLRLNSPQGLKLWLDQVPVPSSSAIALTVSPGPHVLTLAVDLSVRHKGIRCELSDEAGSPAGLRFRGGK
jgi:putative heme-binding domain-containing protein